MKNHIACLSVFAVLSLACLSVGQETLPPLSGPPFNGQVPTTLDASWMGFDPRAGAIEATVHRAWSEQNCSLKVISYSVGIFKGQKQRMVGILGYPVTGSKFPGLLHIHGGGQAAMVGYVTNTAANGYAVLSLNWGAKPFSIGTQGTWSSPNTDWRSGSGWDGTGSLNPSSNTIDNVVSPRNNGWWLLALASRRGLTYLENVPKVDSSKLGVWGFSMGGVEAFIVAAMDKRVKAAVEQAAAKVIPCDCSNWGAYKIWVDCISAFSYAPKLTSPMMFDNGSNDYHGTIDDIKTLTGLLKIPDTMYRWTRAVNNNHRETEATSSNIIMWFNHWLKDSYAFPKSPRRSAVKVADNTIVYTLMPDTSKPIKSLSIYHTIENKSNPIAATDRVWTGTTPAKISSGIWRATLPAVSSSQRMRIYAAVEYTINPCVKGGWGWCATGHQITSDMDISDNLTATTAAEASPRKVFSVRATMSGSKATFSSSNRNHALRNLTLYDSQGKIAANLSGNRAGNGRRPIEWDYHLRRKASAFRPGI